MSIDSRVSNVRPWVLVGLLGLTLAACAPKPAPDVTPATEPVVEPLAVEPAPPDLSAFYERLDGTARLYEDGTQLVVAGEEVLGERQLVTATNRLVNLAAECAATEGCELDRVLETFQSLLQRQGIEIKKQASLIESLETSIEDAEREQQREPGTSAFSASMPELDRTVTLLRGTELQEIINLNGPVQAALDDWLTWMRPLLIDSWENYQYLRAGSRPSTRRPGCPKHCCSR